MRDNKREFEKNNLKELKKYFVEKITVHLERKIGKLQELKTQHNLSYHTDLELSGPISKAENVLKRSASDPNTTLKVAKYTSELLMKFAELKAELKKENAENVLKRSASDPNTTLESAKSDLVLSRQLAALELAVLENEFKNIKLKSAALRRKERNDAEKAKSMQHEVKSEQKPNDRNRQNQLAVKPKAQSTKPVNKHEAAEGLRGELKKAVAPSKLHVSAPEPRTPLQMRNDAEKAKSIELDKILKAGDMAAAGRRVELQQERASKFSAQKDRQYKVASKRTTENRNEHQLSLVHPVSLIDSLPGNLATRSNFADSIKRDTGHHHLGK